ncbi:MAG TPA: pyridoxal-phosphate dependent enzyme [bacterium]|nr:pyridoxal-phosphate dependent enzyme [bacterium]
MQDVIRQSDRVAASVWQYSRYFSPVVSPEFQLSLGEGGTRLEHVTEWGETSDRITLYVKREDENPHGSFKDRSLAYRISLARQQRETLLVLSSSGNAGCSAAAYCAAARIPLLLFLSPDTPSAKLAEIALAQQTYADIRVVLSRRAMRLANYASAALQAVNIRPSLDDFSLPGYATLAYELQEQLPEGIDHLFSFATSDSSLLGMGQGWQDLLARGVIKHLPALHAVQTKGSIASFFDKERFSAEHSDNLGISRSRREQTVVQLIRESVGSGWYVLPDEMAAEQAELNERGIITSWEGAAVLSAVKRALQTGCLSGRAVAIFSGKHRTETPVDINSYPQIESIPDLEAYLHRTFPR